jgi:hypothetical protein
MNTPELHRLVMQRDAEGIARLLGTGGHDIDACDASGKTALMYAARDPQADARSLELLIHTKQISDWAREASSIRSRP